MNTASCNVKRVMAFLLLMLGYEFCYSFEQTPVFEIQSAWVRIMPPGHTVTAAYFEITNISNQVVNVTSVEVDWAKAAHLHFTKSQGGVSQMESLDKLELEPGQTQDFAPGGRHVMIMGLQVPLNEGERLPIKLKYQVQGTDTQEHDHSFLATVQHTM